MPELSLNLVSADADAYGDVVFVHGLGGSAAETWKSDGTLKKGEAQQDYVSVFPSVLAADFPELNIWTLDYPAAISKWSENLQWNELSRVCHAILEILIAKGIGTQPVVFVCHSLSGIVAKEVLRLSWESQNRRQSQLFKMTRACSFLATPHKGSNWAGVLETVNSILPFVRTTSRIEELEFDNTYLEKLAKWYRETVLPKVCETQAFYEQNKTKGIIVVKHVSANPDVAGCDPIPVRENHISIAKPRHKNSTVYLSISGLIRYHLLEENDLKREGGKGKQLLPPQTIVIGIVKFQGKVLMVRRKHMIDRLTWQFVAGRLKVGQEDPGKCIVREVKEETGVSVKATKELGTSVDEHTPYKKIYFACEYLSGTPHNADSEENEDVQWVAIDQIERFVTTPLS